MSSVIQVNRIYLIFNPVHFLVDSSDFLYLNDWGWEMLTYHKLECFDLNLSWVSLSYKQIRE